ncbi:MAG: hypothetical protein CME32_03300 [Gimesia sp.]|nr:hypothetical protein [Gimesia sp.]
MDEETAVQMEGPDIEEPPAGADAAFQQMLASKKAGKMPVWQKIRDKVPLNKFEEKKKGWKAGGKTNATASTARHTNATVTYEEDNLDNDNIVLPTRRPQRQQKPKK